MPGSPKWSLSLITSISIITQCSKPLTVSDDSMSTARFCNASVPVPLQANSLYIFIHVHTCFTYTKFLLNSEFKWQASTGRFGGNNMTQNIHVITPCITVTTKAGSLLGRTEMISDVHTLLCNTRNIFLSAYIWSIINFM
jgi:hypothetical protein